MAAARPRRTRQIHCSWTVMGLEAGPVTSSCGVSVLPNGPLLDPRGFDYVAVCGGAAAVTGHAAGAAGLGTRLGVIGGNLP